MAGMCWKVGLGDKQSTHTPLSQKKESKVFKTK